MTDQSSRHRRRSLPLPPLPWLAILLAVGAVILGGLAVAHLRAAGSEPARLVVSDHASRRTPYLRTAHEAEFARCRAQVDVEDSRCRDLWNEEQRRFLGSK